MKKLLLIFTVILVGLFVLLSVFAPKNNYAAKKQLWKINQKFKNLVKETQTVPEKKVDQIILRYQKFIQKFPKSPLRIQAHFFLGDAYIFKEDNIMARQKFEEIIQEFSDHPDIIENAMLRIVTTFTQERTVVGGYMRQKKIKEDFEELYDESLFNRQTIKKMITTRYKEENFKGILDIYQRALKNHPTTSLGLKAPLLIARLYYDQDQMKEAKKFLKKAIQYYPKFSQQHKNTIIDLQSQELLVTGYLAQKKFPLAVETLGNILIQFAEAPFLTLTKGMAVVKTINMISIDKINDPTLPITIYQKFILTYPKHNFVDFFEKVIINLQNLHIQ
ncbi:hypothetical protein MNBD_UNCLBAC01-318 [hydrothermal vent metagenome]|uniref:Uncharacterized protein n=1 Tax=hydrothermal vent metagenome TaxID=652676 RepID=A0A3B1DAC9_9ZZZZ